MSDPFIGEIKMVAFNFAPVGWAQCLGQQQMSVQQNQALYALIGNAYGGTAPNTFGLPDLRGRSPVGVGQGTGLQANVAFAQLAGSESVTLTQAQMPSHAHGVGLQVAGTPTNPLTGPTSTNNVLGASSPTGPASAGIWSSAMNDPISLAPSQSGVTGGNAAVGLRSPYIGTNFIIALQGIYPSRQ